LTMAASVLACTVSASPRASASPASSPTADSIPASPIVGVVIRVENAGLNDVQSFQLRTNDGRTYQFKIGELENPTQFPSGHLREHMATSSMVRVLFRVSGDLLVAYRLEDG